MGIVALRITIEDSGEIAFCVSSFFSFIVQCGCLTSEERAKRSLPRFVGYRRVDPRTAELVEKEPKVLGSYAHCGFSLHSGIAFLPLFKLRLTRWILFVLTDELFD